MWKGKSALLILSLYLYVSVRLSVCLSVWEATNVCGLHERFRSCYLINLKEEKCIAFFCLPPLCLSVCLSVSLSLSVCLWEAANVCGLPDNLRLRSCYLINVKGEKCIALFGTLSLSLSLSLPLPPSLPPSFLLPPSLTLPFCLLCQHFRFHCSFVIIEIKFFFWNKVFVWKTCFCFNHTVKALVSLAHNVSPWSSSSGVFSGYSGFFSSFIG